MLKRPANPASVLEHALLGLAALAAVAMLSFPAARSVDDLFGWLPFWLMALPLSAWGALCVSRRTRTVDADARPLAVVYPIDRVRIATSRTSTAQALRRAA